MAEQADPSGRHTGARAIPTVEERVSHIVGMMERFEWERGKSAVALAEKWALAVSTVEHSAAEASRRCTANAEEVARDISIGGRQLLRDAIRDGRPGDFTKVGELLATISGAKAPEKHQIGTLDGATPGRAREVMGELFGGVTPEGEKPDADPER
jgi:hypothetical protein